MSVDDRPLSLDRSGYADGILRDRRPSLPGCCGAVQMLWRCFIILDDRVMLLFFALAPFLCVRVSSLRTFVVNATTRGCEQQATWKKRPHQPLAYTRRRDLPSPHRGLRLQTMSPGEVSMHGFDLLTSHQRTGYGSYDSVEAASSISARLLRIEDERKRP